MQGSASSVSQLENVFLGSADLDTPVPMVTRVALEMLRGGTSQRQNQHQQGKRHPGKEFHGLSIFWNAALEGKIRRARRRTVVQGIFRAGKRLCVLCCA
jgi:hypothetical protein